MSEEPNSNKLQVIHYSERDHWITAITIGCELGVMKVYNSLYTTLDKSSSIVLANFVPLQDQLFNNRVVRPQKRMEDQIVGCVQ